MPMKGTCKVCKHWKRSQDSDNYRPEDEDGECSGLGGSDNITFLIEAGWNGGYIAEITTKHSFSCGNYEEKDF